jgi:hypothetical protein
MGSRVETANRAGGFKLWVTTGFHLYGPTAPAARSRHGGLAKATQRSVGKCSLRRTAAMAAEPAPRLTGAHSRVSVWLQSYGPYWLVIT